MLGVRASTGAPLKSREDIKSDQTTTDFPRGGKSRSGRKKENGDKNGDKVCREERVHNMVLKEDLEMRGYCWRGQ